MKWRATFFLIAAVALQTGSADATQTGYDLFADCSEFLRHDQGQVLSDAAATHASHCLGYMSGIYDGLTKAERLGGKRLFCAPGGEVGQLVQIFVQWAKAHPGELSRPANDLATAAIVEAFPCRTR